MAELLILSRAVHFGSCLLLLALFVVRRLIEPGAGVNPRAVGACLAVAAGSGFLWFWVSVAGMSGGGLMDSLNRDLFQMVVTQTLPGEVWLFRAGVAAVLAVILCIRPIRGWGIVPAVIFVGSIAWLGHAGAGSDTRRPWMLAADVAHLLAASLWPAGLLPFALLLKQQIKAGAWEKADVAARRFSAMSLVSVSVLAATGSVNAWFLVGSFHGLVAFPYGRLLILKLTFFAAAVALGSRNLLIHKPRREMVAMARKVWAETALGALAVAVVAIMGTLPPSARP
ncbi:MAG TPA: CopD family protein [Chthoniobacteraceae bacterium]|jgi:putative copper resistance protein D|nr:CopD family protein [Chthoniobacteraceae bacterium]